MRNNTNFVVVWKDERHENLRVEEFVRFSAAKGWFDNRLQYGWNQQVKLFAINGDKKACLWDEKRG